MRYVTGVAEDGGELDVRDPLALKMHAIAADAGDDAEALFDGLVGLSEVFGADLAGHADFRAVVVGHLESLFDEGARAISLPIDSAKVKSGLGLVPRRAIGMTPLWRRRFDAVDIASRIERDHRPYHAALADALAAARAAFGVAILIDIHSMPRPASGAEIVLGDRFGRAAGARFVARAEAAARGAGYATALNLPYAGGHILATHGAPGADIHAIQLEIDRTAYLDAALDRPGPGLPRVAAMLRQMIAALAEEALDSRYPLAAE